MSDQPTETSSVVRCALCGYEGPAHDCTTSECRDATLQRIATLEEELRLVRGAMAAQDGREREAGERCGVEYHVYGCDWPDAAAEQILALPQKCDHLTQRLTLAEASEEVIGQLAGKALGYPWFKDDQQNFPGATEAEGVCIGEHVAETIVQELVQKYQELQQVVETLEKIIADRSDWGPGVHHVPPWRKQLGPWW
jgi:hypothetical protein